MIRHRVYKQWAIDAVRKKVGKRIQQVSYDADLGADGARHYLDYWIPKELGEDLANKHFEWGVNIAKGTGVKQAEISLHVGPSDEIGEYSFYGTKSHWIGASGVEWEHRSATPGAAEALSNRYREWRSNETESFGPVLAVRHPGIRVPKKNVLEGILWEARDEALAFIAQRGYHFKRR